MYTINDALMLNLRQRSLLQQFDLETRTLVTRVHERSKQHELVCFAPGGHEGDWGNELYAGAVHKSKLRAPLARSAEGLQRVACGMKGCSCQEASAMQVTAHPVPCCRPFAATRPSPPELRCVYSTCAPR